VFGKVDQVAFEIAPWVRIHLFATEVRAKNLGVLWVLLHKIDVLVQTNGETRADQFTAHKCELIVRA